MNEEAVKKTLEYFSDDYNCSQAVLKGIIEELGYNFVEAPMVTAAYGGGIIGRGEVCGAVSGAIMAIGVINGNKISDLVEYKKATGEDSKSFYKQFERKFGCSTCNGIIGVDPNDPDGREKARDAGTYAERCPKFVAEAVRIVLTMHKK
ncbi:MAG: C-GCAxxG-C-C family protein [Candidatus Heimdallarchaeota archaeon]